VPERRRVLGTLLERTLNMGSSGKKKTTMAKLAREHRLRERRLTKEAKKDARKRASSEGLGSIESLPEPGSAQLAPLDVSDPGSDPSSAPVPDGAGRAVGQLDREPSDPRDKEVALRRLHDASDEKLAVFEGQLRDDALKAGATESEMRYAQRDHPGHGA
jgi:hypothetical protein